MISLCQGTKRPPDGAREERQNELRYDLLGSRFLPLGNDSYALMVRRTRRPFASLGARSWRALTED